MEAYKVYSSLAARQRKNLTSFNCPTLVSPSTSSDDYPKYTFHLHSHQVLVHKVAPSLNLAYLLIPKVPSTAWERMPRHLLLGIESGRWEDGSMQV